MGHFAQYRKRGGGNQGFIVPPPVSVTQWTSAKSTTHIQVTASVNPGSGVVSMLVQTYNLGTPNVINETFAFVAAGSGTGSFTYTIGVSVVGVRTAWSFDGVKPCSPWSTEQQQSF